MAQIFIIKKSEFEGAMRLDAEYYQPKYRIDFGRGSWVTVGDIIQMCQYGISKAMMEEPVGYPIFRMDDIKNAFLADDEVKYIQMADTDLKKYRLELDDILFNRVNSEEFVGRTGIFKLVGDYVFASYLIRIRVKPNSPILADYLNAFLNSSFGIKQIRKLSRRAVNQANVNAEELKSIKIAVLSLQAQEEIKHLCDKSFAEFETSKSLYLQAEQLLLDELGFKDLDLSHQLYYTVPFKKTEEANRLDAEHFQPKYERLLQHLTNTGKADLLGNLVAQPIKRGLQPEYDSNGGAFAFTEKDLGRHLLNVEGAQHISEDFWRRTERGRVRKGDVLLYSIGAYIGRANVYLENAKAIASSNLTTIRTDKAKCNSVYLALYLNSPLGRLQAEKWTASVGQMALYPSDVPKFVVYLPSMEFQQRIADLVTQSWEARQKARQLLEEAKHKVENMVEGKSK